MQLAPYSNFRGSAIWIYRLGQPRAVYGRGRRAAAASAVLQFAPPPVARICRGRWPNSRKAPDALLKLGYTQFEQKKITEARATLALVQMRFPGSEAAKLAADRLQKMPAEAH